MPHRLKFYLPPHNSFFPPAPTTRLPLLFCRQSKFVSGNSSGSYNGVIVIYDVSLHPWRPRPPTAILFFCNAFPFPPIYCFYFCPAFILTEEHVAHISRETRARLSLFVQICGTQLGISRTKMKDSFSFLAPLFYHLPLSHFEKCIYQRRGLCEY